MNTQKLSKSILVYNINSTPNKTGQILEVVDVILYYKMHLEQVLLTVSSLDKQDLIFSFT